MPQVHVWLRCTPKRLTPEGLFGLYFVKISTKLPLAEIVWHSRLRLWLCGKYKEEFNITYPLFIAQVIVTQVHGCWSDSGVFAVLRRPHSQKICAMEAIPPA